MLILALFCSNFSFFFFCDFMQFYSLPYEFSVLCRWTSGHSTNMKWNTKKKILDFKYFLKCFARSLHQAQTTSFFCRLASSKKSSQVKQFRFVKVKIFVNFVEVSEFSPKKRYSQKTHGNGIMHLNQLFVEWTLSKYPPTILKLYSLKSVQNTI